MHYFKIRLLSITMCLACLVTVDARMRIVGGNTAARGEYPFYFWAGGSRLCGGSLIWGDFVLTAAHCGHHVFYKSVKYGSTNVIQGNEIDINKLFLHPKYNETWMANDVMLIQLKKFIPQSEVKYVTLNTDPKIPVDGAPITAMGYGADGRGNHYTESLMKVDLNVVGYSTCVKTYGASLLNNTHMICNGGPAKGGKDSCFGDSGGPIMLTGTDLQVGLVSWGRECGAKDTPAVNARVSEYVPWIQEHICMYSVQPPPSCPPRLPVVSLSILEKSSFKKTITAPVRKPTLAPIRKPTLAPIRKQTLALARNLKPTLAPLRKVVTPVRKTLAPIQKATSKPVRKPSLRPTHKPTITPIHKPTTAPIHLPTLAPIYTLTTAPAYAPRSMFGQAAFGPSTQISDSSLQSTLVLAGSESTDSSTSLLEAPEGSEITASLSADPNDALVSALSNL